MSLARPLSIIPSAVRTAIRKARKEKLYVAISVISLAIGFASALVISLYVRSELTYDQHHLKHERIYRTAVNFMNSRFPVTGEALGPLLAQYSAVEDYVRFRRAPVTFVSTVTTAQQPSPITTRADSVFLTDPSVFSIFDHPLIYGDSESALSEPNNIVISESLAFILFGNRNPIGEVIEGNIHQFTVSGVFANHPENTHFKFSALLPMSRAEEFIPSQYGNESGSLLNDILPNSTYTYLLLNSESDEHDLKVISQGIYDIAIDSAPTAPIDNGLIGMQPLADVHHDLSLDFDEDRGNLSNLIGLIVVAAFLLITSSLNFVVLATARISTRLKELSVRRLLGASRSQLMSHVLGEAFVLALIAFATGGFIAWISVISGAAETLLQKSELASQALNIDYLTSAGFLLLFVWIFSGLYPALKLSQQTGSHPIFSSTSDSQKTSKSSTAFRHLLVMLQIGIAIAVISSTFLFSQQINYLGEKPLGFDKENQLIVPLRGVDLLEQYGAIKAELLSMPSVNSVTLADSIPGRATGLSTSDEVARDDGSTHKLRYASNNVDPTFISSLNLELLQGRTFPEYSADTESQPLIVNEALVKEMGWAEPIGRVVGSSAVIGVIKDFNYNPLYSEIGSYALKPLSTDYSEIPASLRKARTGVMIINISDNSIANTIENIGEVVGQFDNDLVYSPEFLASHLEGFYQDEQRLATLLSIFAVLTAAISLMGLYGLTTFSTARRSKEIGIRKVVGASVGNIIALFLRSAFAWIFVAAIPATLISYSVVNQWLNNFAFRIEIGFVAFLFAIGIVTLLSLTTIALQSRKAATVNPVEVLR